MATYSKEEVYSWMEQLRSGEITPEHTIEEQYGDLLLLQAIQKSELNLVDLISIANEMISLGCDVDRVNGVFTPLSMAVYGSDEPWKSKELVSLMLKYHKFGDLSDLSILQNAARSLSPNMFHMVVASGKVDTNATRRETHILHYLTEEQNMWPLIPGLFKIAPHTKPNPINRKGYSPLALAFNNPSTPVPMSIVASTLLQTRNDFIIIGKLTQPIRVINYDVVDRYQGNFWEDYPETIKYAVNNNKGHLLPKEVTDIFLF